MTISSAVPASQACRMEDKRERDAAKVEQRWWDEARENVKMRWLQENGLDVALDCIAEYLHSRPITADCVISDLNDGLDCDVGRVWVEAFNKYMDEFLEDHRHLISDECWRLEDSNE